jgi:hypothetical protein
MFQIDSIADGSLIMTSGLHFVAVIVVQRSVFRDLVCREIQHLVRATVGRGIQAWRSVELVGVVVTIED